MEQSSRPAPKQQYLMAYNAISALLWTGILGRVLVLVPLVGAGHVYGGVGRLARWTQTGAVLEVLHSAGGVVRAPVATTALQVASRLLLVWGVVEAVPAVGRSPFYSSMLVAWAVTEVVRYSFFVMNLQGDVPAPLAWLRYNTFFVLYPVGIASELALVAQAGLALGRWWLWAAVVIAAIYVPGSYILFTHMMTQRRKVIRGKAPQRRR